MFPRFDDALIHNQRRTNLSWANTRLLCLFVDWCIQLTLLKSVVRTILPFLESLTNDFCFIFQNLNYFSKRLICDLWESVRWQLGDSTEFFPGFPIRLTEVDRMRRCLSLKPSPTSQHAKVNKCFFSQNSTLLIASGEFLPSFIRPIQTDLLKPVFKIGRSERVI